MSDARDSILVAGSANLDFVVRAPHIPAPGETVLGGEFATYPGGKGANQAVAAARAGANTQMLVALGDDAHAAPIEASLRDAGVQLAIVRDERATGAAFIVVADNGENAITVASGANAALRREHLPTLDRVSHLLLQLETPPDVVEACAKAAQAAGVCTILNAAPAQSLTEGLLGAIDVLIVNEGELAALTGDGS
ncbi:MAG: PfkB family carbohydrate kinase, partial [Dokdonella sp.]